LGLIESRNPPLLPHPDVPESLSRAVRPIVESLWREATEGRLDDRGQRTFLSAHTVGTTLYRLSPMWRGDDDLCRRIATWLDDPDSIRFLAALRALSHTARLQAALDRIEKRLARLLDPSAQDFKLYFEQQDVLRWLEQAEGAERRRSRRHSRSGSRSRGLFGAVELNRYRRLCQGPGCRRSC
jgi:hypothetical protein